jgi:hypothetical protein
MNQEIQTFALCFVTTRNSFRHNKLNERKNATSIQSKHRLVFCALARTQQLEESKSPDRRYHKVIPAMKAA